MASEQGDNYRLMLINSILLATSNEQVKRFIETAIQAMKDQKVNNHIITRFVNKVIDDLSSFTLMEKHVQQRDNIKFAKIMLNRIWVQFNTPTD